jgi:hypothetical protein
VTTRPRRPKPPPAIRVLLDEEDNLLAVKSQLEPFVKLPHEYEAEYVLRKVVRR